MGRDIHRDFLRNALSILGCGTRTDNRDSLRVWNRIAPYKQHQRRTCNFPENRRIFFICPDKDADVLFFTGLSDFLRQAWLFRSKRQQRPRRLFAQMFLKRPRIRPPCLPGAARIIRQAFRTGDADAGRRKHRRKINTVKRHRRTAFSFVVRMPI